MTAKPAHYYNNKRSEMLDLLPATINCLLDVGCGEALFSQEVKKRYQAEVWGIEMETAVAAKAAQRLDKVFVGTVEEVLPTLPDATFDCIVFNDILEHLAEPTAVLEAFKRTLTPNGVIVCSIPNMRNFHTLVQLVLRKQWRYTETGVLDRTHLRFFTALSIQDMLESLDYEIVKLYGIRPVKNRLAKLISWLTFGYHDDICYLQIACQAKPR